MAKISGWSGSFQILANRFAGVQVLYVGGGRTGPCSGGDLASIRLPQGVQRLDENAAIATRNDR